MTNLVNELLAAAPPGETYLTREQQRALVEPTRAIVQATGEAAYKEYLRFLKRKSFDLSLTHDVGLEGKTVLVTGGTGCIGTALLKKLVAYAPARVVSISRGVQYYEPVLDVEYRRCDVRDLPQLLALVESVRPDYIFNLAAQHDPGLAEREVARTFSTNVGGVANLIEVCRSYPEIKLVHASTGKALRPFTPDVYASSKKMAETLLTHAAGAYDINTAAVRFTHVIDNSIVAERLQQWTRSNGIIRLHSVETAFYVQSAAEAADLLITALTDMRPGQFTLNTIRDLDWPIGLLDLAVGHIMHNQSQSPIYVCGHEEGYEAAPYPGLYDPRISAEMSPLLNALESYHSTTSASCTAVDSLTLTSCSYIQPAVDAALRLTKHALSEDSPEILRSLAVDASWIGLEGMLHCYSTGTLERHVQLLGTISNDRLGEDDRRIKAVVLSALT